MNEKRATQRFYDLIWPQRAAVLRLARFVIHDPAEAEDLAQETLIKAFKKIAGFREGSDVKAWLFAILRHTRIDRYRAAASKAGLSLSDLEVEVAAPVDDAVAYSSTRPDEILNAFSDQQVIEALQELPEEIRWTLLLVDVEGMIQRDAAEVLQVPVGTIKSRLHRGHLMLRDRLLPIAREWRVVRER